ncbi:MAG: DUF3800 domain-containing protein [Candidatus Gracilibacteria bacterium]|nr:DUF3800 domain-containing protein [Candidatus Gracilibacteria bacterium]
MMLFYLDESGNTGNDLENKEQPIHFINGIGVNFNDIQNIEKDMKNLEINFLPFSQNFDFEFHAIDMAGGKKYFKNFKIDERLKAFEGLINIFEKYDIKFFSQGINKQYLKSKYDNPYHPHYLSFMYLIEKIDRFLEDNDKKGLIIMDKNLETEQNIINNFQDYKKNGTSFGLRKKSINCLIDTVYYTDSYNSYLMQLSDVIGYIYGAYKTASYLGNIEKSGFMRKELFKHYEKIIAKKQYIDVEPKSSSRVTRF